LQGTTHTGACSGISNVGVNDPIVTRNGNDLGEFGVGKCEVRVEFDGATQIFCSAFEALGGTSFAPTAGTNIELVRFDIFGVALGELGSVLSTELYT